MMGDPERHPSHKLNRCHNFAAANIVFLLQKSGRGQLRSRGTAKSSQPEPSAEQAQLDVEANVLDLLAFVTR
jgi:hypothetical protein